MSWRHRGVSADGFQGQDGKPSGPRHGPGVRVQGVPLRRLLQSDLALGQPATGHQPRRMPGTDGGDPMSQDWRGIAACRPGTGVDPELFFPVSGHNLLQTARAKAICGRCPVIEACGWHAIDRGEDWGIWGGVTPEQRRRIAEAHRVGVVERPRELEVVS